MSSTAIMPSPSGGALAQVNCAASTMMIRIVRDCSGGGMRDMPRSSSKPPHCVGFFREPDPFCGKPQPFLFLRATGHIRHLTAHLGLAAVVLSQNLKAGSIGLCH